MKTADNPDKALTATSAIRKSPANAKSDSYSAAGQYLPAYTTKPMRISRMRHISTCMRMAKVSKRVKDVYVAEVKTMRYRCVGRVAVG